MADKNKSSAAKLMGVIAAVGLLIAVAVVAVAGLSQSKEQVPTALEKVKLNADILAFAFRTIPNIYTGLVTLNNEVLLIDKELERLSGIESEFPDQKKIVNTERLNWNKVKKSLQTAISKIEKTVEAIYVTHLVNPDKGKALIEKDKKPLSQTIEKALAATAPHVKRLETTKKQTFMDRIKEKLL